MIDAVLVLVVGVVFVVVAPRLARLQIRLLTRGRDTEPSAFLLGILRGAGVLMALTGLVGILDVALT